MDASAKNDNSLSKGTLVGEVILSLVAIVLGYFLIFKPNNMDLTQLCLILCFAIVTIGVVLIVAFFVSGNYKRVDSYGFAVGFLCVIVGLICLLRVSDLAANFDMYIAMLSLFLGVIMLQSAVQIRILRYPVWILNLILSIFTIGSAFCILADITMITNLVYGFPQWVLLESGIACLVCLIIDWICMPLAKRRDRKAAEAAAAQPAPQFQQPVEPAPAYQPAEPAPAYQPAEPAPAFQPEEPAPAFQPEEPAPAAAPAQPVYDGPQPNFGVYNDSDQNGSQS